MTVLALYNLKGGVGKTAAAVNLAYLSSADGYKTLVWDLDPQASASFYLDTQPLIKNSTKKLFEEDLALKDAIQSTAFENFWVIPSDISARNTDVLLDNLKKSRKKLKLLLSDLKQFD